MEVAVQNRRPRSSLVDSVNGTAIDQWNFGHFVLPTRGPMRRANVSISALAKCLNNKMDQTMTPKDPPQSEVIVRMMEDHTEMVTSIAAALCVKRDRTIQARLRVMAHAPEDKPFLISLLSERARIEVGIGGEIQVQRIQREPQPAVDILEALATDSQFRALLYRTMESTSARDDANNLLTSIISTDTFPIRAQFRELNRWSPLIEHIAYRYATRVGQFLDSLRPIVLDGDHPDRLAALTSYWSAIHLQGHMVLLASAIGARPWLSDMANEISWVTWTPTFPLLRERTVWLAACAARSAIAFGPAVINKYLSALSSATHPMKVFDALFGLSAIALAEPDSAPLILVEIRKLEDGATERATQHKEYIGKAYADAIAVISASSDIPNIYGADCRALGWFPNPTFSLATGAALRGDPTAITATGHFLGFAILPAIVNARREEYYPLGSGSKRPLRLSNRKLGNLIHRAWQGTNVTGERQSHLH